MAIGNEKKWHAEGATSSSVLIVFQFIKAAAGPRERELVEVAAGPEGPAVAPKHSQ